MRDPVVWVVNHYTTLPSRDGAGHRHFRLAQEMRGRGWNPVLILASTQHPSGSQYSGARAGNIYAVEEGVSYAMLRVPAYRGGVQRLRNMFYFTAMLVKPSSTRHLPAPDLVIGSTVHLGAAWGARRLARRHGVPFVFEIRDIWPETLIDLGRLRAGSRLARLMKRFARRLCADADLVISPLPGVREYLDGLGLEKTPFKWISNGVDLEEEQPPEAVPAHDDFTVMYLGSLGNANGVRGLLEAFDRANDAPGAKRLRLRIVGDGTRAADLQKLAASLRSADAITFERRIPRGDVVPRAREADALIVNIEDLPVYRFGISLNKLFDYLAAARPIIIATSASNNPVAEAGAGFTVPAGDLEALAAAIRRMSETSDQERAAMGRRGRTHVESEYTYASLGARLAGALEETVRAVRASTAERA